MAAPVLRAITATPPSGWNLDGQGQPCTSMTFSTPGIFIAASPSNDTSLPPVTGGRAFQHGARRRADLAHWHQVVPGAARSVGILIAELDFVAVRLLHLYARPVGLQFLGHDQRQAGSDARSHF